MICFRPGYRGHQTTIRGSNVRESLLRVQLRGLHVFVRGGHGTSQFSLPEGANEAGTAYAVIHETTWVWPQGSRSAHPLYRDQDGIFVEGRPGNLNLQATEDAVAQGQGKLQHVHEALLDVHVLQHQITFSPRRHNSSSSGGRDALCERCVAYNSPDGQPPQAANSRYF